MVVKSSSTTTETTMDEVRASASARTAAEKLEAMRKKMEECGVDGESWVVHLAGGRALYLETS